MYAIILKLKYTLLTAVFGGLVLTMFGCAKKPQEDVDRTDEVMKEQSDAMRDDSIHDFQSDLLALAFETASSIPLEPFIKDRSRCQQAVVDACIELRQPMRAILYADGIDNWRRGLCYANAAYYLVQNGATAEQVREGLELAEKIAALDHGQKWRSDRIKARVAATYLVLGQVQKATGLTQDLVDSEANMDKSLNHSSDKSLTFEDQVKKLDAAIAIENVDVTQQAFYAYAALFDRYYDNPERRDLTEEKIKIAGGRIPVLIRLESLMKLVEYALNHQDSEKALLLLEDTQHLMDQYQWPLEKKIPLSSEIHALRYKAGDTKKALADTDALLELYELEGEKILFTRRIETLLSLAESYQTMGNSTAARFVYKKTFDEIEAYSTVKLRAENLSAIYCSMASKALEPDPELWEFIQAANETLSIEQ